MVPTVSKPVASATMSGEKLWPEASANMPVRPARLLTAASRYVISCSRSQAIPERSHIWLVESVKVTTMSQLTPIPPLLHAPIHDESFRTKGCT